MPRLRQVPRSEASPEVLEAYTRLFQDRDPVTQPGTATGTPGNWWTVMALVPAVLTAFQASTRPLANLTALTPYQKELGLLRTGFAKGSKFVYSQHCKALRRAGASEEKIQAISTWASSDLFDPMERAILAYTDELVLADGRVQDATFARLKEHLTDEAILELTYGVVTYMAWAVLSRGLRLEYDDVDERVVEVPAPSAAAAAVDIGAIVSGQPR
ncbi:MAG: carboxymuconolactone decarboxylase family protein [Dehalococcoidia bacterium]|jgi:alkylhydroperoxidase family enzyme|nr:carboxymuconolactone decarboxylase family protein [Dehalococcoidia bacterium]